MGLGYNSDRAQALEMARSVHRASAALPAAGAYTSQAYTTIPAGIVNVAFWISYTRGAAGGYPAFRVQWSDAVDAGARDMILDESSLVVSQPEGTLDTYQETITGPTPQTDDPLVYIYSYSVPPLATGARLIAAEVGVVATPGTLAIGIAGRGSVIL